MSRTTRHRDLALVRRSGGSPRFFDLALLTARRAASDQPPAPFFHTARLNWTLLIKHTLRAHERQEMGPVRKVATKIVFPIDQSDLSLGGSALFAEEIGFARKLQRFLGPAAAHDGFQDDLRRIKLLADLPMFDRFLMRERCRMSGLGFPDALVDGGPGGDKAIIALLFNHIRQMFLGATGSADLSRRIAEGFCFKVFSADFAEYAARLNEFFGLDQDTMLEALFAWKCVIYQAELFERARADLASELRLMMETSIPAGVSDADRRFALATRERCRDYIRSHHGAARLALARYNSAYRAFSERRQPGPFIGFLNESNAIAAALGESLALLMHYSGFIGFRLRREQAPRSPAACIEFHQDLACSLDGETAAPALEEI